MGRELRRVPANYQHPTTDQKHYIPVLSEDQPAGPWYQVYESVTEGTPVTPPFETLEELEEHLVREGDVFMQMDQKPPPSRDAVREFLKVGYAATGILAKDGMIDPYTSLTY